MIVDLSDGGRLHVSAAETPRAVLLLGHGASGKIDGGASLGQYKRMTTYMGPSGAGSQFASLSAPGLSFWI